MTWTNRGWNRFGSAYTEKRAGVPVNGAPVADPQSVSVLEDGYIAITLTATDPQGDPLTYAVLSGPSNGVLTGTAPNLIYTPTPNYFGSDSFTFIANDGYLNSNIATVSITVISVNDAPTADAQSVVVDQDGYLVITLTGSDPEGNPLTYSVTSGPSDGYLTGTAPVLTYFPDSGYVGPDSFTFTVNDGYVDSAPATVSIDVQSVFPVATLAADFTASATIPSELTFSRASTGTYYDSAGILQYATTGTPRFTHDSYTLAPLGLLVERQSANDALNSADFTGWLTYDATVTRNTTDTLAPDGTQTAVKMVEVGGTTLVSHGISPTTGTMSFGAWSLGPIYTASFYAKAGPGRGAVTLRGANREADGGRFLAADYFLDTGEVSFGGGFAGSPGIYDAGIERCANGWWRCWLTWRAGTSLGLDTNLELMRITIVPPPNISNSRSGGLSRYWGVEGAGVYIWGMQVEAGQPRPSSYIPTTSTAQTRAADALDVASTAGWYDDAQWTVTHDARYMQATEGTYLSQAGVTRTTTDQWRTNGLNGSLRLGNITYAKELGLFVAVTFERPQPIGAPLPGGPTYVSSDGMNWSSYSTPLSANNSGIAWSAELGLFVVVCSGGSGNRVMTSPDGVTWTGTPAANNSAAWESVAWSPQLGLFAAVAATAGTSSVMTSADGINWALQTTPSETWREIIWAAELGLFVAVGSGSSATGVMTSPDGITWTAQTSAAALAWRSVAWSPDLNLLVAVSQSGTGNRVMTSPDGISWTSRTSALDIAWESVAWSPELGQFAAWSSTGSTSGGNGVAQSKRMVSSDGITWGLRGSIPPLFQNNYDEGWSYRGGCWSPQHGIFAAAGWGSQLSSTGTTLPPTLDRKFVRYRSTGTTDTWVTGAAAGFLNSGIVEAKIKRFAYYDTKLTPAELAALGY